MPQVAFVKEALKGRRQESQSRKDEIVDHQSSLDAIRRPIEKTRRRTIPARGETLIPLVLAQESTRASRRSFRMVCRQGNGDTDWGDLVKIYPQLLSTSQLELATSDEK